MNAVPPLFSAAPDGDHFPHGDADTAAQRWAALVDAAGVVAMLAGVSDEREASASSPLAGLLQEADPWRRERAERGIADISAFMEPGIAALLSVNARGADPRPAALALWHEFAAAHAAMLSLLGAGRIERQASFA